MVVLIVSRLKSTLVTFETSGQVVEECNVEMWDVLRRTGISERRVLSGGSLNRLHGMILRRHLKIKLMGYCGSDSTN